ncbi:pyridoxine (pyridoxamine) 5'-phosphate oxidase [Yamadazyma tenuis]|uniref:NAD(P)H-hydrate epimerase n=1 Tax=Candida tenuis (strain ATCC 10573 / BCRC 21748 / CBS 615 / JCM 9827 / NBRC 10315 / NRRL Y-1498 / VKM Y-70) TaxID=590646 RepID=G3BD03_CANTC|nr:uncharacterized protein CANTEDRAFT_110683 [Yamadazyma tenuis ATCC 10573]EGV60886.1 hypothetical protein CANTEDRAFT_110683 [Yamadazyma tenuis ATCC 10573]WEJ93844.1 pyridoxine (pyridoxamine) 5'-phosphate oxidase [Yamadazyma tenuis]
MFQTLSAKAAIQLDQELMSTGAFSIDQLMELAGLAVAQAVYKEYPPVTINDKVLILVGPGNNGGDGLVAARHLKLWNGYEPVVFYPKKTAKPLYTNLMTQLKHLGVSEVTELTEVKNLLSSGQVKLIIDSLFGFSFKPPIRAPFDDLIKYLCVNHDKIAPIASVDIPSGWDVSDGPVGKDMDIKPSMLISLTAPKPCAVIAHTQGVTHYLGGRFINGQIAAKYHIEELIAKYKGNDMVVKL